MAKMHSRKRGKSGSVRPVGKKKPSWMSRTPRETELLIVKLAKEGKAAAQIGLLLRDEYGVPNIKALLGKNVTAVLKEHKLVPKLPYDILDLIKRSLQIRKHLEANRQDMPARRGLLLTESKIKRLMKYYKEMGRIDQEWKYDPKTAGLLVDQ
ncbi:30S ribosomal protein S15 [Candidatus Woesearchaeota archaeon]|nr:30S ribosomal protein S15 [Candidatus Woesearchaeota archaeon]